jgi:hypothetical protein
MRRRREAEIIAEKPSTGLMLEANLKKRIEAIMNKGIAVGLSFAKSAVLAVVGSTALVAPIVVGVMHAPPVRAQASAQSLAGSRFDVASIKPNPTEQGPLNSVELGLQIGMAEGSRGGRFHVPFAPLHLLIALAYNAKDFQIVGEPSWASSDG